MDGLLLLDKPSGPTSHDLVAGIRRLWRISRVGHFGTLDPLATGLLLVALGQATRFNRYYAGRDKRYRASARLGVATDTYDAAGTPLGPVADRLPSSAEVAAAAEGLRGEILQTPPPYSAKKVDGRPLYASARAGRPVHPAPAKVTVHELEILRCEPPDLELGIRCSTGTYVRSLVHDLGLRLGCGAHVAALRRTAVGELDVAGAWPWPPPEPVPGGPQGLPAWIPLAEMLPEWPAVAADEDALRALREGRPIPPERLSSRPEAGEIRILGPDGGLAALARRRPEDGFWAPFLVIPGF